MNTWTSYQESPPTEEGTYLWRLKSNSVPDIFLIFAAQMIMRRNGFSGKNMLLSPSFHHWDGYNIIVPPCEWKSAPNINVKNYQYGHLSIEGLEFLPCPYCEKVPILEASQYVSGGGFVVCASPQNYNLFEIKCCAWGEGYSFKDPRDIEKIRREAFSRMKGDV